MARFGNSPQQPTFDFTKRPQPAATTATPSRAPGVRPNKFGGKCVNCDVWVEEGQGRIDKAGDKWQVSHLVCPDERPARGWQVPTVQVEGPLGEGLFTVVLDGDESNYVTLRITRQDKDEEFMPGRLLIAYLSGPDNTRDYTRFGNVTDDGKGVKVWKKHEDNARLVEAVKVLVGDPAAGREAYAMRSERCSRCNRPLNVPASLHRGLGPDCAELVGA